VPERDGYIPGVPCWVDTSQPDPEAAADFYGALFGWQFEEVMPPGSPGKYLIGRLRGGDVGAVGSIPESAPPTAMWNSYVWVDSAEETESKVRDSGGRVLMEPFDVTEAGRMAVFTDPEGAAFCVWQPNQHKGARIVNEAGSLVFTGLATRDVEGAKSFYGSVFGWQTLALDGDFEAWTLPGYGDHLERGDPGLRERIAELGAAPGYEDVVAAINPIPGDQPHVAPHWNVTFATDDADATAQRAAELGGKVLVAPFDAPWVRTTVIADPQGATFIASRFVPENSDLSSQTESPAGTARGA
jgi:predicted enzyme related to lactoylglutathione lyase